MDGIGELAGLAAAAFWACSSLFYTRTPLTAWQINFGKNVLASILLLAHLTILTQLAGQPLLTADARTMIVLALSSIIGIVIGDTFYFRSLQLLGPPRALVVSTTSPLFATVIGWLVLGETLSVQTMIGILVTLIGVSVVVTERAPSTTNLEQEGSARQEPPPPSIRATGSHGLLRAGITAGLIGAVMNAGGATFSRLGTSGSEVWNIRGCDPVEATAIRVCTAAIASILTALAMRSLLKTARLAFDWSALRYYLPAVLCGPWLGIWMSQIAYKNSPLAIALTLTCTSPIFVIPLTRLVYGTPISMRSLFGTCLALIGVYLTVSG